MAESDAVVEGAEPTSPVADAEGKPDKSLFMLILIPLMVISAVGGGALAYSQYPMLAEIAATINGEEEEDTIYYNEVVPISMGAIVGFMFASCFLAIILIVLFRWIRETRIHHRNGSQDERSYRQKKNRCIRFRGSLYP